MTSRYVVGLCRCVCGNSPRKIRSISALWASGMIDENALEKKNSKIPHKKIVKFFFLRFDQVVTSRKIIFMTSSHLVGLCGCVCGNSPRKSRSISALWASGMTHEHG
jgi:hypothetical protein